MLDPGATLSFAITIAQAAPFHVPRLTPIGIELLFASRASALVDEKTRKHRRVGYRKRMRYSAELRVKRPGKRLAQYSWDRCLSVGKKGVFLAARPRPQEWNKQQPPVKPGRIENIKAPRRSNRPRT